MSDKIYAWLLRFYPARFREAFGDQALQLFRDRARHEKGFFSRLRLWFDILADLAISVPRQHRPFQPALASGSARLSDGAPSFHVFDDEMPRPEALLLGTVLSFIALAAVPMFISHFGKPEAIGRMMEAPALIRPIKETRQNDPRPMGRAAASEDHRRVVQEAIANLKNYYVYPDVAQKMADALLEHQKSGDYDAVADGAAFAALLTKDLRDVSHDRHLRVMYSAVSKPDAPTRPPPEIIAQYRRDMLRSNCTFEKAEILPHNIGYLKLNAFPDPALCQPAAAAAMAKLNHADAIIFDLRENHGGSPKMVALIATYLFDHPTHLTDIYDRVRNSTVQSWTLPPVPGNKLSDKPAYILTSAGTFSGAEEFGYDLKMLKRATLVGETTAGGAHLTSMHRMDDHFSIAVPSGRPINPISKTDWEGTGVQPDVSVDAEDALATAEKLAWDKLRKK
jgi:Peptidase family S41/N-terminal domain of Peptidase_S41 in eukaryotic IRBP